MSKKQHKTTVPTKEEFLAYTPQQGNYQYETNDEGTIQLIVPKFKGQLGSTFCKLIKRENTFKANLDTIGSFIWQHCDGKTTVKQILSRLLKEFPDEENMEQRLFMFLQQMDHLGYIRLK